MFKQVYRWLLAAVAVMVLPWICEAQHVQPQAPNKVNVILILLDQLQADQLHCYGNPRVTSPNIDRLAEQGIRFSHYYSAAPWTSASDASLMTSLYPSRHKITVFWKGDKSLLDELDEGVPTLAQVFQSHGYLTAAFVNNSVGGKPVTGRGFDEYYENAAAAENIVERDPTKGALLAPATTQMVLSWLNSNRSRPFFLWVLLLEPHSPYNPPPADDIFKSDAYPNLYDNGYDIRSAPLLRLAMLGDSKAIERLYQLYDGKIHFVDRYIGQMLDEVKNLGLDKNTIIIFTSDHGELMFSHPKDYLTADHVSLYDPAVHIPLIISGPNLPRGKVINALGVNTDTSQTILNLADLPLLPNADGKSLVPLIRGTAKSIHHYIFAEQDIVVPERSVRNSNCKLIYNVWGRSSQLFNLRKDPEEQTDIASQNPAVARSLYEQLQKRFDVSESPSAEELARWKLFWRQFPRESVVDDQTVLGQFLLTGGGWHSDTSRTSGNFSGGSFWTENGTGSRTAVWRQTTPLIGPYKVYVYYGHPQVGKLASNALFTIVTDSGSRTVKVDFNEGQGKWNLLGTFNSPHSVSVNNKANGIIIADAIKYVRLD